MPSSPDRGGLSLNSVVAITAPAGYLRLAGDHARIVLNTGGTATVQGVTLETAQAASLEITARACC